MEVFKRFLIILASAAVISSTAAQSEVRIALAVEPGSLDLHADTTTASLDVNQAIYETLIRFDHDMNLVPWLATEWEQVDETTYRFKLREGVRFHSGNPFNAEAAKAHFDRMTNPDNPGLAAAYLFFLDEAVVVDEYTLELRLKQPYGPTLAYLALPFNGIQDAAHYHEVGDAFGVRPSGTGPYRIESWDRGSALNLSANPNYWGGVPSVERLQFRIIPEPGPRTIALQREEVHVATQISIQDIPTLQNNPNVDVTVEPEPRRISWLVNLEHPILSDINVRRALTYAIDYDLVYEVILEDYGRALNGFVTPESFGYLELPYEYDPDRATELLNEAGWERNAQGVFEKGGQPLELTVMTGNKMPRELEVFEAMQNEFRAFGIVLTLNLVEGAQIFPNIARFADMYGTNQVPDFALLTMDFGMRTGEANIGLETTFRCGGSRNASQYCDPEFDHLLDVAISGVSDEERQAAYHDAQRLLAEAVPAINLWQPSWAIATNTRVGGMRLHPAGVWFYEDLTFDGN